MQNVELPFTGPTRYTPPISEKKPPKRMVWILLASVLVHVVILASLTFNTPPSIPPETKPIKAVLFFPPIEPEPHPVEVEDVPQVEPPEAEQVTAEEQSTETEADTLPPPTNDSNDVTKNPTVPDVSEPDVSPDSNAEAETPESTIPQQEILTQAEDSPAEQQLSISKSISSAIQQQHQSVQQSMAEQAAKEFRKAQTSPDLGIGEYQPKEKVIGEHKINCDKGINSSLAMVAGLFGGNVKCERRNEFQQFIDKRLHKTDSQED